MRCRISIKILQRLTTNVKMKRITKEVFLLIIFTGSLFCFVVLDYEGRFYGIQSLIFNNNFLPNNDSFEMDDYEIFRILDMDGFRIAGPGFRMNGTNNKISSIESLVRLPTVVNGAAYRTRPSCVPMPNLPCTNHRPTAAAY